MQYCKNFPVVIDFWIAEIGRINRFVAICITQVACGTNHVIALSSDNQLYAWGSSSYGQLGLGHEKFCNLPMPVELPADITIKNIFAKHFSSALLDISGHFFVCGDNTYGKLGVREDKLLQFQKSVIKDKAVRLSIGRDHSIVMTYQKKVIGIGNNNQGQLGMGNCKSYNLPQNVQLPLNITMVSCGDSYTAVGTDCNAVYVWGKLIKDTTSLKYLAKDIDLKSQPEISEVVMKPKCILALYASKERLKAGHKIWLDDIAVVQNSLFIVVHTTAPPPLKKLHTNNNNRSNMPDWMDTNIDLMQTTLPNTPQFT